MLSAQTQQSRSHSANAFLTFWCPNLSFNQIEKNWVLTCLLCNDNDLLSAYISHSSFSFVLKYHFFIKTFLALPSSSKVSCYILPKHPLIFLYSIYNSSFSTYLICELNDTVLFTTVFQVSCSGLINNRNLINI